MSMNCKACEDLKTSAPSVVINGIGDTEVASLKNNTGLNPSNGNDNCTDLNNLNDCLVGNMEEEVKLYDVCDWQEFMGGFIPNISNVLKAVISAICGLWQNVSTFDQKIDAMCQQSSYSYAPPVTRYGSLPNAQSSAKRCGVIGTKGGEPLLVPMTYQEVVDAGLEGIWEMQDAGISYGRIQTTSCASGACQLYEWIAPSLLLYRLNDNVRTGDILWTCTKAEALNVIGMTEALWNMFRTVGYTWTNYPLNNRKYAWFRLVTEKNGAGDAVLSLEYQGTSYPNESLTEDILVNEPENPYRLYTTSC